jgi:diguanylate cyclase (GGDEF)-like protein
MKLNPSFKPDIKIIDVKEDKEKALFEVYKKKIETGSCQPEELEKALRDRLLTGEECATLFILLIRKLERKIGTDPLTQLFDKTNFESKFNAAFEELNKDKEKRKSPVDAIAVVYFDVVRFKEFNDNYGHIAGDRALVVVSDRMRQVTRQHDMLFRVGGDEFVAILLINDASQILQTTFEDKRKKINTDLFIDINGINIPFNISMGFEILHKGDKRTFDQIIEAADKKMYADKANNKKIVEDYSI